MSLESLLQVLGFIGAAVAGSFGTWKVVDELLRRGKTSLREDYRFAREFFASGDSLHPVVTEMGYQAIAGDGRVTSEEVSYLLTLQRPREALRNFIAARHLLQFFSTAPIEKISFKPLWAAPSRRRALRFSYAAAYFSTYSLGFCPLPLVSLELLSVSTGLSLFVVTAAVFFPLALISLKAARKLKMAESLIGAQSEAKNRLGDHGAGIAKL
jgi:hypothetical protein